MRFHVLGLGSIGTLISYHLRRTIRLRQQRGFLHIPEIDPIPPEITAGLPPSAADTSVTLHLRREYVAKAFLGVSVEHAGVRSTETELRLEAGSTGQVLSPRRQLRRAGQRLSGHSYERLGKTILQGPSIVEQAGYTKGPDAIDSLIVTTKADATVQAIAPLSKRLTPASTVVLLQNGMGVVDELIHTVFPDTASRPQIILGNLTHGCYSRGQFQTIHAGYGSMRLGLLPDPRGRADYERSLQANATSSLRIPDTDTTSRGNLSGLDFNAIPRDASHLTLRYTLASLLSLPLDVHWDPLESYQVGALRKLVVNACINPLTAIMDCMNGQLVGDPYVQQIWSEVCHEAAEVFLAAAQADSGGSSSSRRMPEYSSKARKGYPHPSVAPWTQVIHRPLASGNESEPAPRPLLDPSLTPSALLSAVQDVAVKTRKNFSSMHSDVRGSSSPSRGGGWKPGRGRTEIDYMNGYLVQLGKAFGVDVKTNEMLRRLVLSLGWGNKQSAWRRRSLVAEEEEER